MNLAPEKLAEALALPKADRAYLARELILSLDETRDSDSESEWREVIDRRSDAMEAGHVSQEPLPQLLNSFRAKLHGNSSAS